MRKYRIIEDTLGRYRVQYKRFFIWWTVQEYVWAGSWDAVFKYKEDAEERIKELIVLDNYKKVSKIHKV